MDLSRLAIVPAAGSAWTTAVGALLDAVDVVAARPPRLVPGEVRRLAARARTRDAVLMPYLNQHGLNEHGLSNSSGDWPGADVRLRATAGTWAGIGDGTGRLRARRVDVHAEGKGTAARPRSATLWLPAPGGGIGAVERVAPVVELAG